MLKTTPFHVRTAPLVLGATWRRWAGHAVASAYDWTHERVYAAVRRQVPAPEGDRPLQGPC